MCLVHALRVRCANACLHHTLALTPRHCNTLPVLLQRKLPSSGWAFCVAVPSAFSGAFTKEQGEPTLLRELRPTLLREAASAHFAIPILDVSSCGILKCGASFLFFLFTPHSHNHNPAERGWSLLLIICSMMMMRASSRKVEAEGSCCSCSCSGVTTPPAPSTQPTRAQLRLLRLLCFW